jgi:hypothetical protein
MTSAAPAFPPTARVAHDIMPRLRLASAVALYVLAYQAG